MIDLVETNELLSCFRRKTRVVRSLIRFAKVEIFTLFSLFYEIEMASPR